MTPTEPSSYLSIVRSERERDKPLVIEHPSIKLLDVDSLESLVVREALLMWASYPHLSLKSCLGKTITCNLVDPRLARPCFLILIKAMSSR